MSTAIDKVIDLIKHTAALKSVTEDDDFNPMDYSGGNFDDAFEMGVEEGYIRFAEDLLDLLNDHSTR
jgi:hypothetical protein